MREENLSRSPQKRSLLLRVCCNFYAYRLLCSQITGIKESMVKAGLPLLLLLTIFGPGYVQQLSANSPIERQSYREAFHCKIMATNDFMKILAIKPGMTILDIGTGTGQFAFKFAREMKGTGMVFATDIDSKCIDYVRREAAKRGLVNLYPVLVKKEGFDEFYSTHRYDLITIFHLPAFRLKAEKLRIHLADEGRIIIALYKKARLFSATDFTGSFRDFIKELSSDDLFYKNLSRSTRQLIKQSPDIEHDEVLKNAVVRDLNNILSDNQFCKNFLTGQFFNNNLSFSPSERDFADLMLMDITEHGLLGKNNPAISLRGKQVIMRLNKMLIFQKFRTYFVKDMMFVFYDTEYVARLQKAGYKLEKIYNDLVPFEDILVFRADRMPGE